MLELLTATGLATAAGLNAGLPLLVLGAVARWTDLVTLPVGWGWLADERVLLLLGVLVVLDVVADKVPGLDSLNDVVQTVVRPTAGGLAFGAGAGAQTLAVDEPTGTSTWLSIAAGVLLALAVHAMKSMARPLVNAGTAGLGGPLVSVLEDGTSLALTVAALLLPVLVVVILAVLVWVAVRTVRARRRRRRGRRAARAARTASTERAELRP